MIYSKQVLLFYLWIPQIDVTEESWFHLFPSEDVIYLTPDASEGSYHTYSILH